MYCFVHLDCPWRDCLGDGAVSERERFLEYRIRILPTQLEAARRKVAALEREAVRLGMTHLLEKVA